MEKKSPSVTKIYEESRKNLDFFAFLFYFRCYAKNKKMNLFQQFFFIFKIIIFGMKSCYTTVASEKKISSQKFVKRYKVKQVRETEIVISE